MAHPCLLRQAFQIMVLESLGGRVGRGSTETFGSGNGSDAGNAGFGVAMMMSSKPVECRIHHSCESQAVGFQGLHFLFYIQRVVLPADAGTMEVEVHASQFFDEFEKLGRSIGRSHVYLLVAGNAALRNQSLQSFNSSSGNSYLPSFCSKQFCHFHSDARCGTHYNCFLCHIVLLYKVKS